MSTHNINTNDLVIIRPAAERDLSSICEIASKVGPSISLPNHEKTLEKKVIRSLSSFSERLEPDKRLYLFVLENSTNNEILGTAAIESTVKNHGPFCNFTVGTLVQSSHILKETYEQKILYFGNQYQNASMLETLYLTRSNRGMGYGQLLSRSRCAFIANFPDLFSEILVANMRGFFDEHRRSPFWDLVCYPFFHTEFRDAYYHYSTGNANFINELAPRIPIYVSLLPKEVQAIIGVTHEHTKPALHVLQKEGFMYRDAIDIFDGGPIVEIPKKWLRAVTSSNTANILHISDKIDPNEPNVIKGITCNCNLDFRATMGLVKILDPEFVEIEAKTAEILKLSLKDKLRYYSL